VEELTQPLEELKLEMKALHS